MCAALLHLFGSAGPPSSGNRLSREHLRDRGQAPAVAVGVQHCLAGKEAGVFLKRWAGVILGVGLWLGCLPLYAQTPVVLTSSAQTIDFVTGSAGGALDVLLGSLPADDPPVLSITGGLGASGAYTLTTSGPLALTPTAVGAYTASNAAAVSLSAFNAAGQLQFTAPLTSLAFSQSPAGGPVYLQATAADAEGGDLSVAGTIEFPLGVTLGAVASSRVATDAGGPIVPEPATIWLFALGLLGWFFIARRRHLGQA